MTAAAAAPADRPLPLWRRLVPFVAAAALVGFALARADLGAFLASLSRVNAPAFVGLAVAFLLGLLTADVAATLVVYRRALAPIGFGELWMLRGASYVPSLLNHHVGQAFLAVTLARRRDLSLARVAGATLVVYASWIGWIALLACVSIAWAGWPKVWIALLLAAGIAYLALIAARPARLARVQVLAPLFEAGLGGHLLALAARTPHVVVLFLGTWLSLPFFGVAIPLGAALARVPILMVAVTLPLTPQGFGTRDVLAAALFEAWAPGAGHAERLATLAAATTTWGVMLTLFEASVGLVCLRRMGVASSAGAPTPRS